ncbi:flavin reductase family protein [Aquihabitans sp. G128]|uniref:flavin reductase family protein n=1 Tax=Aquihabitans sp. G128 TaxID=2849779 RepID=UPI001C2184F5|nr:flavin reductase family protein [Aquihabitans sp. G128]QXC61199.1 flavin reductase family protein [Aquihabitans sp. G128]
MTEPVFDSARFRQVLGHFPTGVCVVSAMVDDAPVGMAIGSFFSISLDPPLVGFCAGKTSSTWPKLHGAGRFCASILADDQEDVCRVFASKEPDKFSGIGWDHSPLGSPRLKGALAWIDCELDAVHEAGDHDIAVGAVHDLHVEHEGKPLVFFRGGYGV